MATQGKKPSTSGSKPSAYTAPQTTASQGAAKKTTTPTQTAFTNAFSAGKIASLGKSSQQLSDASQFIGDLMQQSAKALEEAFSTSMSESKKAQSQAAQFSRESAEKFAKGADNALKAANETIAISKEHFDALAQSGAIASKMAKTVSEEVSDLTNTLLVQNLKSVETFLGCKTVGDFYNLQANVMKKNMDTFFSKSMKLAEIAAQSSRIFEPVNEKAVASATKLSKTLLKH